jgi:hypothetical protein
MLLRIVDHFRDNPKRIDKLIAIKGLPEEWFFRDGSEGRELKRPWEPDIDKNIPYDIRSLCEPMYVVMRFPPIDREHKEFIEKKKILGLRLDYNTEPGRQMWDDVERYIEETMPRGERIPIPVLCAKDERSAFETYTPRRNSRGSVELVPGPVPMVDLTQYVPVKMVEKSPVLEVVGADVGIPAAAFVPEPSSAAAPPVSATAAPESAAETPAPVTQIAETPVPMQVPDHDFKCQWCEYRHAKKAGVHGHEVKRHIEPANREAEAQERAEKAERKAAREAKKSAKKEAVAA